MAINGWENRKKNVVVTKTPVQVSDHGYPPTRSCEEEDARQMLHHLKIIGSLRLALHLIICVGLSKQLYFVASWY
ncbi:hypothetical protein OIU79_005357 [Salix purpurea]|uniref:Uncharacterized protein n=1 Tax=Salix purpurea TaxID=77065 RepID=A0A9Q0ZAS2_SALPP|nr:hypothetical protein OIU79_005357 [Salix purpurea]